MLLALGLLETKGLVGAIEAADAMAKAADVKIISKERVTGAMVLVKIAGEVAAVRSAIDAGTVAAQRVGQLVGAHVIPRPDDQLEDMIYEFQLKTPKVQKPVPKKKKSQEEDLFTAKPKEDKSEELAEITTDESIKPEQVEEKIVSEEDIPEDSEAEQTEEDLQEDEEIQKEETVPPEEMAEEPETLEEEPDSVEEEPEPDKAEKLERKVTIPPMSELEILNVHKLRKLAREIEDFPIKGREISKANRGQLLDIFQSLS
ncbi:MAG: BMC domain-containing protein [Melioribacteraceae bacterium]|nr:BMC domain-containing protein [Melioribacteraceae bacterium]MCF8355270.1 BMC domain-containing protein [Melioribacteraceae bacterium]MCF8394169.1 BMC domain-containing protein [Melioribacteraceae bacterium]MCF8418852.1 BMC domain-containing protein [Melioribacteraceae bacterium]